MPAPKKRFAKQRDDCLDPAVAGWRDRDPRRREHRDPQGSGVARLGEQPEFRERFGHRLPEGAPQTVCERPSARIGDRVTLVRRLGVAADDVVAVARETGADLIALAWSQNLSRGHARVVSETLAHTDIPVLLLPVR